MIILSAVLIWQINHLRSLGRWVAHTDEVISETYRSQSNLISIETNARGYLLSGSKDFLSQLEKDQKSFADANSRLARLTKDNAVQTAQLASIHNLFDQWFSMTQKALAAGDAAGLYNRKRVMDQIRAETDAFISREQALRIERERQAEHARTLATLLTTGLAIFLGIFLAFSTRRQLGSLSAAYRQSLLEVQNQSRALKEAHELLEKRVQERTAALVAANQELEAFSYSVSHDLRSPLRGIDGFSLALLEDYGSQLDETARDYLDRVRRGTQKMGKLIDDLLALSRVSRAEIKKSSVDLSSLALQIIEDLRLRDPTRNVEVHIEPGLTAHADSGLLYAALENLLSNAWKFTSKKQNARIEFGQKEMNGTWTYYVTDNGAGFDMAYVDKLFGAFQRLHSPNDFTGTGIGLATVRRIMRRHGGDVWAEASPDKGAVFYFHLGQSSNIQAAA